MNFSGSLDALIGWSEINVSIFIEFLLPYVNF